MYKNKKFNEVFKISALAMKVNGSHPFLFRTFAWVLQFLFVMTIFFSTFSLLLNSIIFHDIKEGRITVACKNGVMVLISVIVMFKYVLQLRFRKETKWLIKYVEKDYQSAMNLSKEEQNIIQKYSDKGVWVCYLWLLTSTAASSVFPIKAATLMIYRYCIGDFYPEPLFDFTHPFQNMKNDMVVFVCMFVFCFTFGSFATTVYTGFDPLAPIFMLHACGQLEVIEARILKLFPEENFRSNLAKKDLNDIISHLQQIYRFVDCIKRTTSLLYEFTMKLTTILIPFTAYQIVESIKQQEINFEFLSMEFGCFVHFFIPCYYSNLLMEKKYSSVRWETRPAIDIRKCLLLILMRSSRSLAIRSIFCTISLGAFAEMCRQSYTIFNVMNAAWN